MKIISYYTDTGSYSAEADLYRASLRRVGMDHHIERHKDGGDWYANTRYKARFIQKMRRRFTGPLLYIDVDAFVHENCERYFAGLESIGADFGAHWFRGPAKGFDRSQMRDRGWWMLSGTLYIGDTPGAARLVDTWRYMNDILFQQGVREGGGQKNLWYLTTCMGDLEIARLPGRYCYVFDKPWAYPADEPCVIEHTIASRDHRGGNRRMNEARRERIDVLRDSITSGRAAPQPYRDPPEPLPPTLLEVRQAAGRALGDAKRAYQAACLAEREGAKE